jgi:hypothetical protein
VPSRPTRKFPATVVVAFEIIATTAPKHNQTEVLLHFIAKHLGCPPTDLLNFVVTASSNRRKLRGFLFHVSFTLLVNFPAPPHVIIVVHEDAHIFYFMHWHNLKTGAVVGNQFHRCSSFGHDGGYHTEWSQLRRRSKCPPQNDLHRDQCRDLRRVAHAFTNPCAQRRTQEGIFHFDCLSECIHTWIVDACRRLLTSSACRGHLQLFWALSLR